METLVEIRPDGTVSVQSPKIQENKKQVKKALLLAITALRNPDETHKNEVIKKIKK